jgi:hypothetical protein
MRAVIDVASGYRKAVAIDRLSPVSRVTVPLMRRIRRREWSQTERQGER